MSEFPLFLVFPSLFEFKLRGDLLVRVAITDGVAGATRVFDVVVRDEGRGLEVLVVAVWKSAGTGATASTPRLIMSFFGLLSRGRFLLFKFSIGTSGAEVG